VPHAGRAAVPLLLVLLLAACPKRRAQTPDARPTAAADTGPPAARYEACARLDPLGGDFGTIKLFGLQLAPKGATLAAEATAGGRSAKLTLGVLGDTKEALPATLARLDRLVQRLSGHGVDAVILLGGIEASFEGIREVLDRLKRAAPVLALPGDRESKSGFQAAARAHAPKVVDLVQVRAIATPFGSLLAVPGYHLPHHLHAREQGCSYGEEEIRALVGLARKLPGPRVLLAHGPPRGDGRAAVDRAFGQVNVGDPLLRRLMKEADIAFGLFAHVHESAGHATTLDGEPVREMTWSDSLLLNVGSADSVPHEDLAGRWSKGSAALVELRENRARYRMLDLARLPVEVPSTEPAMPQTKTTN
jgi:hypothetical protein